MQAICPFLALEADGRSVVDGYDAAHRCQAVAPPDALDRSTQLQLCLSEAHRRCERYVAALDALTAGAPTPRLAPDVTFQRTRLILEPEPAWRMLSTPQGRTPARVIGVVAGTALAGAALAAVALAGPGGPLAGQSPSATPAPSVAPVATSTPSPEVTLAPTPSAVPTLVPTPGPSAPGSLAPTPQTYVVQSGDTLNAIALRFGTTVAAIQEANGLTGDVINVGQVLIIP